jgi:hypothetical protein
MNSTQRCRSQAAVSKIRQHMLQARASSRQQQQQQQQQQEEKLRNGVPDANRYSSNGFSPTGLSALHVPSTQDSRRASRDPAILLPASSPTQSALANSIEPALVVFSGGTAFNSVAGAAPTSNMLLQALAEAYCMLTSGVFHAMISQGEHASCHLESALAAWTSCCDPPTCRIV